MQCNRVWIYDELVINRHWLALVSLYYGCNWLKWLLIGTLYHHNWPYIIEYSILSDSVTICQNAVKWCIQTSLHWLMSANASHSQQLCVLQIFLRAMLVDTQKTHIGRCQTMQNVWSLNTPLRLQWWLYFYKYNHFLFESCLANLPNFSQSDITIIFMLGSEGL